MISIDGEPDPLLTLSSISFREHFASPYFQPRSMQWISFIIFHRDSRFLPDLCQQFSVKHRCLSLVNF